MDTLTRPSDPVAQTFPQKVAAELSYVQNVLCEAATALDDVAARNHGREVEALGGRGQTNEANKPAGMFEQVDAQLSQVRELAHRLREKVYTLNATH